MVYSRKFSGLCIVLLFLTGFVAQVSATNVEHTLEWDLNGNLVQDDRYFFEYNGYNQLVKVRETNENGPILEEYWYDHEGQRIKKVEHQTNTTFYYIGKDFVQKHNDSGVFNTTYFYMNDKLVAKNDSGNMTYYHSDHLGSTTLITDENGAEVAYQEYLPYGASVGDEPNEERLYTGQTKDSTDLYYYGARYYNPTLRRFTQPDPIIADVYNPQNLNRYAYVLNNPLRYTDPDGLYAKKSDFGDYMEVANWVKRTENVVNVITYSPVSFSSMKKARKALSYGVVAGGYYLFNTGTQAMWTSENHVIDTKHYLANRALGELGVPEKTVQSLWVSFEESQIGSSSEYSYEDLGSNSFGYYDGLDGSVTSSAYSDLLKDLMERGASHNPQAESGLYWSRIPNIVPDSLESHQQNKNVYIGEDHKNTPPKDSECGVSMSCV